MELVRTALLGAVLMLGGCAVGATIDHRNPTPNLLAETTQSVVLVVVDQRNIVVDGDWNPTLVGWAPTAALSRFPIRTTSGMPLAHDLSGAVASALRGNGIEVTVSLVSPSTDDAGALDAIVASGAERGIVIYLLQWLTHANADVELIYRVRVDVTDGSGTVLAMNEVLSEDELGYAFVDPTAIAAEEAPAAAARGLERLLNDPAVLAALE